MTCDLCGFGLRGSLGLELSSHAIELSELSSSIAFLSQTEPFRFLACLKPSPDPLYECCSIVFCPSRSHLEMRSTHGLQDNRTIHLQAELAASDPPAKCCLNPRRSSIKGGHSLAFRATALGSLNHLRGFDLSLDLAPHKVPAHHRLYHARSRDLLKEIVLHKACPNESLQYYS